MTSRVSARRMAFPDRLDGLGRQSNRPTSFEGPTQCQTAPQHRQLGARGDGARQTQSGEVFFRTRNSMKVESTSFIRRTLIGQLFRPLFVLFVPSSWPFLRFWAHPAGNWLRPSATMSSIGNKGRHMAKRSNHYEAAFEAWLRSRKIPYLAVDESRRSLAEGRSLKNLDFVVSPPNLPHSWLVDVKGRRFPTGKSYWKNWVTAEELFEPGELGGPVWGAIQRPAGLCLQRGRGPGPAPRSRPVSLSGRPVRFRGDSPGTLRQLVPPPLRPLGDGFRPRRQVSLAGAGNGGATAAFPPGEEGSGLGLSPF